MRAVLLLVMATIADALVVPDEVPTLLSLIYSNIPTLKKGTDSRLGWGFRFGDRADFQVLLELGPQKDTQPLANQPDAAHKRAAAHTLANALYAQSLRNKQAEGERQQQQVIADTKGGAFIRQWADDLRPHDEAPTKFTLGVGEVDAKDYIAEDVDERRVRPQSATMQLLAEMYREKERRANVTAMSSSTVRPPKATTSWKDALDNVELE